MITITPANEHYTRSYQDCDEKQALLCALRTNQSDYTLHEDGEVRRMAAEAIDAYKLDRPPGLFRCESNAHLFLHRLYRHLRTLAIAP
jgi:hypothetical protein